MQQLNDKNHDKKSSNHALQEASPSQKKPSRCIYYWFSGNHSPPCWTEGRIFTFLTFLSLGVITSSELGSSWYEQTNNNVINNKLNSQLVKEKQNWYVVSLHKTIHSICRHVAASGGLDFELLSCAIESFIHLKKIFFRFDQKITIKMGKKQTADEMLQ